MTDFTYDDQSFSDIYKDVNGVRPRVHEYWTATPERKQVIWDALLIESEIQFQESQIREAAAVEAFEKRVVETIQMGAGDRETAIRWIVQAEGIDSPEDPQYICYLFGIPYEMAVNFDHINR